MPTITKSEGLAAQLNVRAEIITSNGVSTPVEEMADFYHVMRGAVEETSGLVMTRAAEATGALVRGEAARIFCRRMTVRRQWRTR